MKSNRPPRFAPAHARAAAALCLLLVFACAQASGPPAWVGGADDAHPPQHYLTAVGSGDDLTSAAAQATAGIMQIFVSKVDQTLEDEQRRSVEDGHSVESSELELRTVIESSGAVEGIRITNNWYDAGARRHYALAVLDRAAARRAFARRLATSDADLRQAAALAAASANPLERTQRYAALVADAGERDLLAAQHRFVGGDAWPADPATAALREAQSEAANAVTFDITATLEDSQTGAAEPLVGLHAALAQSVSRAGFKVAANGDGSLHVRSSVNLSAPFERGSHGFTHYTWTGSVTLSGDDGGVMLVYKADGSASHRTPTLARERTRIDAEDTLSNGFDARLEAYLRASSE